MSHLVSLRPIAANDEAFMREMLYQAIYVPAGQLRPPRQIVVDPQLSRYFLGWGRPGDMGYLAFDSATGSPIGAAWLRLFHSAERGYGYIDDQTPELSMALVAEYRGQGIGTLLLTRLIDLARLHFSAICLSVAPLNPARRLYQRLGFAPVNVDAHSITMRLHLGAPPASPAP